jgi:hypothetical protein
VCKKTLNRLGACLYKRLTVLRARERHTAEPPLPPLVLTVNSTLRSLAPPTRVAPACPRTPSSFSVHLLACSSRQLAGVVSPAAAAVGARRPRPPAVSPTWVSRQAVSSQPLDPPEPLPRPSPLARSPESGKPHRPAPPWTTLQGLQCF